MSSSPINEINPRRDVTTTTSTTTRTTRTVGGGRSSFSSSNISYASVSMRQNINFTVHSRRRDESNILQAHLGKNGPSFFPETIRSKSNLYANEKNTEGEDTDGDTPTLTEETGEQMITPEDNNESIDDQSSGENFENHLNTEKEGEQTINEENMMDESMSNEFEEGDEMEEKGSTKKSMWNRVSSIFNPNGGDSDNKGDEDAQREELNSKIKELEELSRSLSNTVEIAEKKLKSTGKEGFYRAAAEIDTYKKRRQDTLDRLKHTAEQETILSSLPVIDMFYDAQGKFENFQEEREVKHVSGYENLSRLFFTKLNKLGVETFDAVEGEIYDPKKHKEVETVFEENVTEMTVKSPVLRGYTVFDKVIRPAEVIISAPPSVIEEEKDEEKTLSFSEDNTEEAEAEAETSMENKEEEDKN